MEILKQTTGKPLHAIFVCCGGGGMLAGIAAYVKRVRPGVLVIGVEAEDAAGMTTSLRQGRLTTLDSVGIFADGAAVRTVGTETFRICNEVRRGTCRRQGVRAFFGWSNGVMGKWGDGWAVGASPATRARAEPRGRELTDSPRGSSPQ